jgi:hypothetical protein
VQGDGGAGRPKLSSLIGHFVGHVFLGTVAFVALAIPAVLLSIAAHYLSEIPVSVLVINILLGLHYFLLVIDALTFVAYILVSVYDAGKQLVRYVKGL